MEQKQRNELLLTWEGIKFRHQEVDVRNEWNKYVSWRKKKELPEVDPSITSLLLFEKQWLKSSNVRRINNPKAFIQKVNTPSAQEVQEAYDIFVMRKLPVTISEVENILAEGVKLSSIEIWFSTGLFPRSPLLKQFVTLKGVR